MAKTAAKKVKPSVNGKGDVPDAPFAEVGSTGLKRFKGVVQEEFDPQLRGPRGVRVYDEMRKNDSDVGAILFAILHIALKSEWTVSPVSESEPDKAAAAFLRECLFEDMSHSWRDFIVDAMSSNAFGWAYFETVFKQRLGPGEEVSSKFSDGRIGFRKLGMRGQETLDHWMIDAHGGIQGMVQLHSQSLKEIPIPINKALLVRTSSEKNNPEGVSLLRTAYRSYFIKTNVEEIEVIGAERDMTGVLVIQLPANAQDPDFNKARDMGERYRVDDQTYFVLQRHGPEPHEGWGIDVLQTPGSKVVDTDKTITRCSTQIMRSMLAQFLMLGANRVGSFALSDSMKSLWHLAVGGRLDTFQEECNMFLVPKLFALNSFPGMTGLPTLSHTDPGEIDVEHLTPLLRVLGELGVLDLTQEVLEHLHKTADLPPPEPDAAERLKTEREAGLTGPQNLPKNPDRQHQPPTEVPVQDK